MNNIENKLILLGDYIDRGDKSCETLYFIKQLSEKYEKQVISLIGNHEEMFLEQLFDKDDLLIGDNYSTMQNYLSEEELNSIVDNCGSSLNMQARVHTISKEMITLIKSKHKDLIV